MKITQSIKKQVLVLCILALCIIVLILSLNGWGIVSTGFFPQIYRPNIELSDGLFPPDARFSVSEYKPDVMKNRTIIHVTDDELQVFTDLKRIFRGPDTNAGSWNVDGQRYIGGFEGNMTQYYNFNLAVCKNVTIDKCFENPPLYEYEGRFFLISGEYFHSHSTARPTTAEQMPAVTGISG